MRAVTGPLKTGTYILEAVTNDGEFVTISEDKSKFALTKCPESEATKWAIESLGNDVYRGTAIGSNLAPMHNVDEKNLSMGEGTADWIIKETDVPGEYITSPVSHPTLYMSIQGRHDTHVEVKSGADVTRGRFHLVEE